MTTLTNTTANWMAGSTTQTQKSNSNIYNRLMDFADSQAKSKTLWYIVSMIAQGVLFLPVPAVLIYYFNAPIIVLIVTLTLFFANIIAGMGGEGIRILILLFASSALIHLLMVAVFVL